MMLADPIEKVSLRGGPLDGKKINPQEDLDGEGFFVRGVYQKLWKPTKEWKSAELVWEFASSKGMIEGVVRYQRSPISGNMEFVGWGSKEF